MSSSYFAHYDSFPLFSCLFLDKLGVVHSACDVLFPLCFAVMSPWENISWEFSLCPDWLRQPSKLHV